MRYFDAIKYRRYRRPDFYMATVGLRLTTDMMGLMAESCNAADITYYLGQHKDRAALISARPLPNAGAAITDIEAQVAQSDSK
jgi:uridylate kinase